MAHRGFPLKLTRSILEANASVRVERDSFLSKAGTGSSRKMPVVGYAVVKMRDFDPLKVCVPWDKSLFVQKTYLWHTFTRRIRKISWANLLLRDSARLRQTERQKARLAYVVRCRESNSKCRREDKLVSKLPDEL